MKSPPERVEHTTNLRPIRFIIYLSGLLYGAVSLLGDPVGDPPLTNNEPLTSANAAAVVGVIQFLAIFVGVVVDFSGHRFRRFVKPVFLVLTLAFLYEATLLITLGADPFRWIPLLVYTGISTVVYLSER